MKGKTVQKSFRGKVLDEATLETTEDYYYTPFQLKHTQGRSFFSFKLIFM